MAWFDTKKSIQELLEREIAKGLDDVYIEPEKEKIDVADVDDIFDSIGETFDSLGETIDSLSETSEPNEYNAPNYYNNPAPSDRERHRQKLRESLEIDRQMMKEDMQAAKREMKAGSDKMKADLREMRKRINDGTKRMKANMKSRPRGAVNIQSGGGKSYGGSSNISISTADNVSISTINGCMSVKVSAGNISEKHFVHKLVFNDVNTFTRTTIQYYDDENFRVTNDEMGGSFNVTDETLRKVRGAIRGDLHYHANHGAGEDADEREIIDRIRGLTDKGHEHRTPPKPEMPPNRTDGPPDLAAMFHKQKQRLAKKSFGGPLFCVRTWKGDMGEPVEITEDSRITVSGHNAFGRKYEVKIDGTAIHVPSIEGIMEFCHKRGENELLIEMRTAEELVIVKKILKGLIAMKIAEPHHVAINELL